MKIISVEELVSQASEEIVTLSAEQALAGQSEGNSILVDIRDIRELGREGKITDAIHAPRGMLEFWFDPKSKYHREVFDNSSIQFVLFCAAGWRSALAAKSLTDMGFENIAHVDGGFGTLKTAGAEIIAQIESKPAS